MRAVWSTVVAPVIEACQPAAIVEVGGGDDVLAEMIEDATRERLTEFARIAAEGDVEAPAADLALVYGRPNWHSVTEALERLSDLAKAGDEPYPVTLVHGVDWPTGRRDSYPDPATVPVGAMQAHAPDAGGVLRARDEHDQRNGVLTAVEDFVASTGQELEHVHVPGLGGTAVLVPPARMRGKGSRPLAQLVKDFRQTPAVLAHIAAIEADRARALERIDELEVELESARAGLSVQASSEAELLRGRVEELAAAKAELKEALARRDARLAELAPAASAAPAAGDPGAALRARTIDAPASPQPIDRRGVLLGEDDPVPEGAEPLDAIVRMNGDAERLRGCLWSLLARADRPLRLTLVLGESASVEARLLAKEVAGAEPRVDVVDGDPPERPGEWALRVDAPVELAFGTLRNLLAAARSGNAPRPAAAVSLGALGVPAWAGEDAPALLLGGQVLAGDADGLAALIVAVPRNAAPAAEAVALDALVVDFAAPHEPPAAVAEAVGDAFADEGALVRAVRERLENPLALAYVLPGMPPEGSGGSHSVFQEARALSALGARVRVLVESEFAERASRLYPEATDLIHAYPDPRALAGGLDGFDVAIATQAPSARLVEEHVRSRDDVLGAYYIQDYEPLFSPGGGPSADAALLSYRYAEKLLLFAKTHWIGNVVAAAHEVPVAKVTPSLDRSVFHAEGRRAEAEPLRVVAMVRPRTPRRRPAETLAALDRIGRELGPRVECLSFGCETEALRDLPPAADVAHLGPLTRPEVAEVMRRSDVFLDLSTYQAFGRTGLEAMACGVVPLLPEVGGVGEYAIDGRNAVVLDGTDEDRVLAAVAGLAEEPERLRRMREAGRETAASFTVTRAALSQYACFAAGLAEMKEGRR